MGLSTKVMAHGIRGHHALIEIRGWNQVLAARLMGAVKQLPVEAAIEPDEQQNILSILVNRDQFRAAGLGVIDLGIAAGRWIVAGYIVGFLSGTLTLDEIEGGIVVEVE